MVLVPFRSRDKMKYVCNLGRVECLRTFSGDFSDFLSTFSVLVLGIFRNLWGNFSKHTRNFLTTISQLSRNFLRTYSEIYQDFLKRLSQGFFRTFSGPYHNFLWTFSALLQGFLSTLSGLSQDLLLSFSGPSQEFKAMAWPTRILFCFFLEKWACDWFN